MTSEGRHLSRAGQCSVNKRKFLITYTKLQNERKKMLILESEKAKLKEPLINKKNENLRE